MKLKCDHCFNAGELVEVGKWSLCENCKELKQYQQKQKKTNWIKPVSKKRAKQKDTYLTVRAVYLKNNPYCQKCKDDGWEIPATEIHHKAGRIEALLCDINNFLPVCRLCHQWIESNPVEAKKRNYSKNRLWK